MSSEHRALILRNDNPVITYTGDWTVVQANTVNNMGDYGPAFSPTLKRTESTGSFSFPFNGISVAAYGTVVGTSKTNPNPSWSCSIDGTNLEPNYFPSWENNWPMCTGNVPDGGHELIVNVTSGGMPFYLDFIQYQPSPNVSRENTIIRMDNPDPAIDYISGWSPFGASNLTADPKSLVNVTFVVSSFTPSAGIQLFWYGFTGQAGNASSGEYSIDGGPFSPFQLGVLPPGDTIAAYNQLFFTTPTLDMGTHVMSVKYTGVSGQIPLTLDYLYVMNGSFLSSTSMNSSGGANGIGANASGQSQSQTKTSIPMQVSPNAGSSATAKSSSAVGTKIVGPTVGVTVAVVVAIIIIWTKAYRKRRQRGHTDNLIPYLRQPVPVLPLQIGQISKDSNQHVLLPNIISPTNVVSSNPSNNSTSHSETFLQSGLTLRYTESQPSNTATTRYSNRNPISSSSRTFSAPAATISVDSESSRRPLFEASHPRIPIQHEDSGIRLPRVTTHSVVDDIEIPPSYTEQ